MYEFQLLYQEIPKDVRVLSGLGMLLSLQRVSLFSGIDLLRESLELETNQDILRQLALIYIAMGYPEGVKEIIRSEVLPIEVIYSPQVIQLRAVADCLSSPTTSKLRRFPIKVDKTHGAFYSFLCQVMLSKNEKEEMQLLNKYFQLKPLQIRCEP